MIAGLFTGFTSVAKEVAIALAPLVIIFLIFQRLFNRMPKKQLVKILKGVVVAFLGVVLFLQGIQVGFLPMGEMMGKNLGALTYNWILIPLGLVIGFASAMAEPAVHVLNEEVERASAGYISKKTMLFTLSIGVAVSVGLAMVRVLTGIPLWYFVLPGYLLVLLLTRHVSHEFVAIAMDSGGVATGPMSTSFILSMTVGIATEIEGRNPLMDGFGTVALVALTPILAVLVLGFLYARKQSPESEKTSIRQRIHGLMDDIRKLRLPKLKSKSEDSSEVI